MNKKKLNLVRPTPEEEEEKIAAQLAEDPDTYEWTNEDWANAQTTEELFPEAHEWALRQKKVLEASRTWPASIPIQKVVTRMMTTSFPVTCPQCGYRIMQAPHQSGGTP